MPTSRTRRLIYTGATAAGLLVGVAGLAGAATSQSAPPAPADTTTPADAPDAQDAAPTYTASVSAPDTENEANLQGLATISGEQASQAAAAATGGTAGPASLENENGNVVYGVEVTQPDGTKLDVKVDAGNATVLSQQAGGDDEQNDGPDTNEGSQEGAETADD